MIDRVHPAARRLALDGLLRRERRPGRRAGQARPRPQLPGPGHRRQDGRTWPRPIKARFCSSSTPPASAVIPRSMRAWNPIYGKYKAKGFEVLAFPANEFGKQEPGSNSEIKSFCSSTYNVTFPLLLEDRRPRGRASTRSTSISPARRPTPSSLATSSWNFNKFLINRKGEVIARFDSKRRSRVGQGHTRRSKPPWRNRSNQCLRV